MVFVLTKLAVSGELAGDVMPDTLAVAASRAVINRALRGDLLETIYEMFEHFEDEQDYEIMNQFQEALAAAPKPLTIPELWGKLRTIYTAYDFDDPDAVPVRLVITEDSVEVTGGVGFVTYNIDNLPLLTEKPKTTAQKLTAWRKAVLATSHRRGTGRRGAIHRLVPTE